METCPICEQGSSLILLSCPNCYGLVAACDEDGSLYSDLQNIAQMNSSTCDVWLSATTSCPHCKTISLFDHATSEQLINYGLRPSQYC